MLDYILTLTAVAAITLGAVAWAKGAPSPSHGPDQTPPVLAGAARPNIPLVK